MFFVIAIENNDVRLKVERLYNDYRYLMLERANIILKDISLAEDAVHESFMRVIKNIDKIDETNCNRTRNFLVIICENIAINIYNKNKKVVSFDEELDENVGLEGEFLEGDPLDIIIDKESVKRLMNIVQSLPPKSRDILLLKMTHKCSLSEISDLLDTPLESVKKRLYRARKMLSDYLREESSQ